MIIAHNQSHGTDLLLKLTTCFGGGISEEEALREAGILLVGYFHSLSYPGCFLELPNPRCTCAWLMGLISSLGPSWLVIWQGYLLNKYTRYQVCAQYPHKTHSTRYIHTKHNTYCIQIQQHCSQDEVKPCCINGQNRINTFESII